MGTPPYLITTFDVGMASWNYFSLVTAIHIAAANMNFVTRSPSCTLVRNSAMPTYTNSLSTTDTNHSPFTIHYSPAQNCLPHSAPMVLIDEVLNVDMKNQIVKTSVKIHDNKIFFNKEINGISPLVGIEFMAQTIGCYAYYKAGKTIPKIGFLLGTRQYENKLEKFENGKTYIITAREIYGDNELVSFECLIYNEGEDENPENYIAKATINAFQPKDVEKYIKELG